MKYFKLLLIGICLALVSQSVYASWMFNPYTRKQDYYEASGSLSWSGLAELTSTTGLDAKYLLWNDGGTSKVMTGENFLDWISASIPGVSDGDKGSITVSSSGATWTLDNNTITAAKMADADHGDVAWSSNTATVQSAAGNFDVAGVLQAGSGNHDLTNAAGLIDGEKIQDDTIDDTLIDWGTGANQVSMDDVPDGSSYQRIAAADVDASNHVNLVQDSDATGAVQFTGLSTTRAITLVDADQTLMNLASAQNISGDKEVQDDVAMSFGNDNDWEIIYDETTDDRLEFTHTAGAGADVLFDLNDNAAASTFTITNSNGTYAANLVVEGTITSASNAVLTAATSWTGGDLGGTGVAPTVTDLTISGEAQGDILYRNATNWVRLAAGTNGYYLMTQGAGANPTWSSVTASAGGDGSPAGQIQYEASGALAAEDAFYYTPATNLLTVGNVEYSGYLASGADPADTGAFRLSNADYIYAEASPAGTDISVIGVNSAEAIIIGASGASGVTITPSLTLSSTLALGGNVAVGAYELQSTGNVVVQLGDNAGSNKFSIQDSDSAEVFAVDSNGGMTTLASAAPAVTLRDSDNAAGTGAINANSSGGANDIILTIGVEDSTGESTSYAEFDGVSEDVEIKKPLVCESTVGVATSLNPDAADGATLGTTSLEWSDAYFADGAVIYGQADQSNTLTSSATAWTFGLDVVVGGSDLTLNAAGVKLTGDGDGALTILGLGDGYDEDLTINLDDTENTAKLSSSTGVTAIDFSALNLTTTGTIRGRTVYGADVTGSTAHDTTATHNVIYHVTAAATITLDAAADAGYGATVSYRVRDAAEACLIETASGEKINLNGTALATGTGITATGVGKFVTLVATTDTDASGTDGWEVWGNNGFASE